MSNNLELFDHISLVDGKSIQGIVDYVNKKHIHFFDLTNCSDPNLVILVMSWKMERSDLRFSIYAIRKVPNIELPFIKLIHKKDIQSTNFCIESYEDSFTSKKKSVSLRRF